MRNADLCNEALVENRAVAGRSVLLQLSIEGLDDEESVGPWIPVQWNIVDQVRSITAALSFRFHQLLAHKCRT